MKTVFTNLFYLILIISFTTIGKIDAQAQQCNWSLYVSNLQPSNCARSGSFTININNPAGLSNIIYSIPSTGEGSFAVQPNSSPNFTSVPSGLHIVKVEAICNGSAVSKTINVNVLGNYIPPTISAKLARNNLSCGAYGRVRVDMTGSSKPYTINIVSKPDSYTGPTSFQTSSTYITINDLVSGDYSFQVTDNCGESTVTQSVSIITLALADAIPSNINYGYIYSSEQGSCNFFRITPPVIKRSIYENLEWIGYDSYDNPLLWAVSFPGEPKSEYKTLYNTSTNYIHIPLPDGKTYKDYVGEQNYLTVYIKSPCGEEISGNTSEYIYYYNARSPSVSLYSYVECQNGFRERFVFSSSSTFCYPINIKVTNNTNTINLEYDINSAQNITTELLPFGYYTATITTGDGYVMNRTFSKNAPDPIPYRISMYSSPYGLHKKINYLQFTRKTSSEYFEVGTTIELISGPPGYSVNKTITNENTQYTYIYGNDGSNSSNDNYYFKVGTYLWRITDPCGTYEISIDITSNDVYDYTIDISDTTRNCQGMIVKPSGTCTYRGSSSYPVYFRIYSGPAGYPTHTIAQGETFLLQTPGIYKIMVFNNPSNQSSFGDVNMAIKTIVYSKSPVAMLEGITPGFSCVNSADDEGQISIRGDGGTSPYFYSLYPSKEDARLNTNLISANSVGDFTNLIKNNIYAVKIEDNCNSSTVPEVKILDLATAQLVRANKNTFCVDETLELYAIALPNPTFLWTGPNGFSSTQQNPVIPSLNLNNAGNYRVSISTNYCGEPTISDIEIEVNERPSFNIQSALVLCENNLDLRSLVNNTSTNSTVKYYKNDLATQLLSSSVVNVISDTVFYARAFNNSTGCESDIKPITISRGNNPVIDPIEGDNFVCKNNTLRLENLTAGGTWTVSDPSIARIQSSDSNSVIIEGLSEGNVYVTYTVGTLCESSETFRLKVISEIGPVILIGF